MRFQFSGLPSLAHLCCAFSLAHTLDRDIVGMVVPILTVAGEANLIVPPQFSNQELPADQERVLNP